MSQDNAEQQTQTQAAEMATDDKHQVSETMSTKVDLDDDDAVAVAARSHAMAKNAVNQAAAIKAENERLMQQLAEYKRKEAEAQEQQQKQAAETEAQEANKKRDLIKQAVEQAIAEIRDGTGEDDELTQQLVQRQQQMNEQLASCRTQDAVEKIAREHEPVFQMAHLASQRNKEQHDAMRRQQLAQINSESRTLMEQLARGPSSGLAVHTGAKRSRVEEMVGAASASVAAVADQGTVNASKDSFFGMMAGGGSAAATSTEVRDTFGAPQQTMSGLRQLQQDAPPQDMNADPVKVGDSHMFVQAFEDSLAHGVIPSEHDLLRGGKRVVSVVQRSADGKKQVRTQQEEFRLAAPAAERMTMQHLRPDDFVFMVQQINAHCNGHNVVSLAEIEEAVECSQRPESQIRNISDVMG